VNPVLVPLLLATALGSGAPDPELLSRARSAVGDAAAVETIRGFRLRGENLPLPDGATSRVRVTLDLRSAMREEIRDAAGTRRTWRSGRLAWRAESGAPKALLGDAANDVHLRYYALCAPLVLARAPADSCEALGSTGEGWTRLALRLEGGMRLRCDLEPGTGRVRRVADARSESGVEWELDDFRTVNGITWPFRLTRIEDGRAVSEAVWERFERADDLEPRDLLPGSVRSDL
jgi:hypothetical protein